MSKKNLSSAKGETLLPHDIPLDVLARFTSLALGYFFRAFGPFNSNLTSALTVQGQCSNVAHLSTERGIPISATGSIEPPSLRIHAALCEKAHRSSPERER